MAEWVTVGSLANVPPGTVQACIVAGEEVAVANCGGTLYAIGNVCSHEYAQLSDGEIDEDDCTVECPLHGAVFDLATGRPRALPATRPVASYRVQVVDGAVQVALEQEG